ncbi:MAG: D-xylose reductase [Halieaceae bacterium]|jgi:D-xylose reductase
MNLTSVNSRPMPSIGLGLWKIDPSDTEAAVVEAIRSGYRHLDSAADYGNEKATGAGIAAAIEAGLCKREELWITSKLWNTYHAPEHVRAACQRSLEDLGVDTLDLYLVHFPIAQPFVAFEKRYPPGWIFDEQAPDPRMELAPVPLSDTWAAMEDLLDSGLVHAIGICNYNTGLLHDLMSYARHAPAMLQVEMHPYLPQEALLRTAHDYGIPVTAFSPLGALSYVSLDMASGSESVLEEAIVKSAASRLGRTPAQIVLRWGIQRSTAIIPKTTRRERLLENLSLFDFELSDTEMAAISALNRNRRFNDPGVFCEGAFNRFHAIYD